MAECYPRELPSTADPNERAVFEALCRHLPDWVVMHSVKFKDPDRRRGPTSEIDIALAHPRHGVLVLEVKGGEVTLDRGTWYQGDRIMDKSPVDQVLDNKHAFERYLHATVDGFPQSRVVFGHGLVFPQMRHRAHFGGAAPRELVWNRDDVAEPLPAVERAIRYFTMDSGPNPTASREMVDLIAPTVFVRPAMADLVDDAEERLLRLTEQQFIVLELLQSQTRALILGGAGTGKTLLSIELARRLSRDGLRVLWTCFNEPLANHVRSEFIDDENVEARHFSSWAMRRFREAGGEPPAHPTQQWWDEDLAAGLLDAIPAMGYAVDAVIVDEGQDFHPSWWIPLELALRGEDEGTFVVFADRHQEIYRTEWSPPFPGKPYHLTVNCRNTIPIAEQVAGVFGDAVDTRGETGPNPEFHRVDTLEEMEHTLGRVIKRLCSTTEAVDPRDIVILAPRVHLVKRLERKTIGGQRINPIDQPGGVRIETIHSFKGLESKCVILLLTPGEETPPHLRYVGMSRPKALLVVIGSAQ